MPWAVMFVRPSGLVTLGMPIGVLRSRPLCADLVALQFRRCQSIFTPFDTVVGVKPKPTQGSLPAEIIWL